MTAVQNNIQGDERFWSAIRFAQVQSAKRERARRVKHLPSELFSEPGWDVLLELYAFELVGRTSNESELIDRLDAPPTVLVRWLKMLEIEQLISRVADVAKTGQVRVSLTSRGVAAMEGYFSDTD